MLPTPTTELVRAECAAFDDECRLTEDALEQLRRQFPRNADLSQVLLKVLTLNKLYSTRINDKDIELTARHIVSLPLDFLLDQGSHDAVDLIANIPNIRKCYSFATKFCSWHNNTAYPLYDGYIDKCLWSYKKQAKLETRPVVDFLRQDLSSYPVLVRAVTDFRDRYGLQVMTFKQLDKFLWRSGRVMQSSQSE